MVYALPNPATRRLLWGILEDVSKCIDGPWLLMGNFNEIVNMPKKIGGSGNFTGIDFGDWIFREGLIDVGFIGQ